jgi:hypothetical protein
VKLEEVKMEEGRGKREEGRKCNGAQPPSAVSLGNGSVNIRKLRAQGVFYGIL